MQNVYSKTILKFIYSEMATKVCKIFPLLLTVRTVVKSKGKISQNSVAFSEYMNFSKIEKRFRQGEGSDWHWVRGAWYIWKIFTWKIAKPLVPAYTSVELLYVVGFIGTLGEVWTKFFSFYVGHRIQSYFLGTPNEKKIQNLTGSLMKEPLYIDDRLPPGWYRKVIERKCGKTAGKNDVCIYSPKHRRFRSRNILMRLVNVFWK